MAFFLMAYKYTSWWFQIFLQFSSRKLGKMIQFDDHIFQIGWFNHQLVNAGEPKPLKITIFFLLHLWGSCRKCQERVAGGWGGGAAAWVPLLPVS